MSKTASLVGIVLAAAVGYGSAQKQAPQPQKKSSAGPDIDFDYRKFINHHLALVHDGEIDKATEFLKEHAKYPKVFANLEGTFKKIFTPIGLNAGKPEGHEFIGYKRFSSRQYQFFIMAYYENMSIQYNYAFERHQGEWKWIHFGAQSNLDEMGKGIPMQLMDDKS